MSPTVQTASEMLQILIVEDEALPRAELTRALMKQGFEVREASNSGEAVQIAKSRDIDVVLIDILLGDGPDGVEAARQIQNLLPGVSFIFVSAVANDQAYRKRAGDHNLRVVDWIEKPIQPALQRLIKILGEMNPPQISD
jgi:CheY-like chemotaxis protein